MLFSNKCFSYLLIILRGGAGGVGRGSVAPPNTNMEGQSLHVLVPKNSFTEVFDNTGDMGDFREHIFCRQTTQELPKKQHHEAGPEQLTTDLLDTVKIAKRLTFWKF